MTASAWRVWRFLVDASPGALIAFDCAATVAGIYAVRGSWATAIVAGLLAAEILRHAHTKTKPAPPRVEAWPACSAYRVSVEANTYRSETS